MATESVPPEKAPNPSQAHKRGTKTKEGGHTIYRHHQISRGSYTNCYFHGSSLVNCTLVNCQVFHCHLRHCRLKKVSMFQSSGTHLELDQNCTTSRAPMDLERLESLDGLQRERILDCLFGHILGSESNSGMLFKRTPPLLAALRASRNKLYREALLVYYRLSVFVLDRQSAIVYNHPWPSLNYIHTVMILSVPNRRCSIPSLLYGYPNPVRIILRIHPLEKFAGWVEQCLEVFKNLKSIQVEWMDLYEQSLRVSDKEYKLEALFRAGEKIFGTRPCLIHGELVTTAIWTPPPTLRWLFMRGEDGLFPVDRAHELAIKVKRKKSSNL